MQFKHAEQQRLEGPKKCKSAKQHHNSGDSSGSKSKWKKKTNGSDTKNKGALNAAPLNNDINCPVHGGHKWGSCTLNPKNKDSKDLDKFRSC